ncbi:hypothetical protein RWV98_05710 [Agathobaculum sp. NTUH-O15-33]|uniref:hypothetical protein n=1 Tax=Agathobaculum sp. NTUH-O15-33 TaxID=3079302 RepID=UPI002958B705|nr:hypothetical protein [Agathobaculum sp. NTUH-O15-33]WNX85763.1 hypothetical protein RWV98_05710 [Agathobaculum sp. NTUH-O15-33]
MARKTMPLRGRSEFICPDGTILPVRDYDGTLLMPAEEWERCKAKIAQNLGETVSQMAATQPELRAVLGLKAGQTRATVSLGDLLGFGKERPD